MEIVTKTDAERKVLEMLRDAIEKGYGSIHIDIVGGKAVMVTWERKQKL